MDWKCVWKALSAIVADHLCHAFNIACRLGKGGGGNGCWPGGSHDDEDKQVGDLGKTRSRQHP